MEIMKDNLPLKINPRLFSQLVNSGTKKILLKPISGSNIQNSIYRNNIIIALQANLKVGK